MKTSADRMTEAPWRLITRKLTRPAACRGAVTTSLVGDTTCTEVPLTVPKRTAVTPVKRNPVTVTRVPPAVRPEVGAIARTVGGAVAACTGGDAMTVAAPASTTQPTAEIRRRLRCCVDPAT